LTSFSTWAPASSIVPTAPMPDELTKSIISRTSPPSTAICGNAATFWKYRNHCSIPYSTVLVGLLARLGDVHQADQAPRLAVDGRAERLRALLHDVPVMRQRVEAGFRHRRADREQAEAVAAGQPRAGR
jgi:hypothetical protein